MKKEWGKEYLVGVAAVVRQLPGSHLKKEDSEGPPVTFEAVAAFLLKDDFGRHVGLRPTERVGAVRRVLYLFGEPEVHQFYVPTFVQNYVFRLQVPKKVKGCNLERPVEHVFGVQVAEDEVNLGPDQLHLFPVVTEVLHYLLVQLSPLYIFLQNVQSPFVLKRLVKLN